MPLTPITRASVVALARSILREKTSDSFDPTDLNAFFLVAYRKWSMELLWPESSWFTNTAVGLDQTFTNGQAAQEYQMPDNLNRIYRVYLRGNRAQPTSIPMMEGDVRHIWDPVWRIIPHADPIDFTKGIPTAPQGSIPITRGPIPTGLQYYLRGGFLGFVPAPVTTGLPIQIDGVSIPVEPRDDNEPLVFPPHLQDGLAFATAEIALISDDRAQLAGGVKTIADDLMAQARRWRRNIQGDMTLTVTTYDYRGFWNNRGPMRSIKSIR